MSWIESHQIVSPRRRRLAEMVLAEFRRRGIDKIFVTADLLAEVAMRLHIEPTEVELASDDLHILGLARQRGFRGNGFMMDWEANS